MTIEYDGLIATSDSEGAKLSTPGAPKIHQRKADPVVFMFLTLFH